MQANNIRPDYDDLIKKIADYTLHFKVNSALAFKIAAIDLYDSLGCAIEALNYPACTALLGPVVTGAECKNGARVPGTNYVLDPMKAAFDIGALIRWLDYNDTWLAAEWGHPSDNLGAILAVADFLCRNGRKILMREVLIALIKAEEIQGILALNHSFNRVGLDHVLLVKLASAAVSMQLLGGDFQQICAVLSQVFVDGQSLRTYRHAPNTMNRKSWAAGDASSRGVALCYKVLAGVAGIPSVLTVPNWGFQAVSFQGKPLVLKQPLAHYTMEKILFKVSFPAEFHGQTAVEAALKLHDAVKFKLDEIERIEVETTEAGMRIINKTGPLYNSADRDHCLQYMIAVALIHGDLTAESYEDHFAKDSRIDAMRAKMQLRENPEFTKNYFDLEKRGIGNSIQVFFHDQTKTERVQVDYPLGHERRRTESIPHLRRKFENALQFKFDAKQIAKICEVCYDQEKLESMAVDKFMGLFVF